jgi:F-type H+-transporting ATPase subunit epsilon
MRVTLISPERALYDGEASAVRAPAYDGEVGILPQHAPFLTLLGEGTLTISQGGATNTFKVRGGFLQVVSDIVRIVAEDAQTA